MELDDLGSSDAALSSPSGSELLAAASPELVGLPVELIHFIAKYLSSNDVVNLSHTCVRMWAALDVDEVWGRYVPDEVKYLETVEQQVTPNLHFEGFKACLNRQRFLTQKLLMNNWKKGNCVKHSERTTHMYRSGVFGQLKSYGQCFNKERYVFLGRFVNDSQSDGINVWDVNNVPVLHTSLEIEDKDYSGFHVIGDYLVVVECIKVYVYRINLPDKEFHLEYSFIFSEISVSYKERIEHEGRHDSRCTGLCHSSVDDYLLMNKCGEPTNVMHVWNIPEARKEGCFESPIHGFSLSFHAKLQNYWVMFQNMQSGRETAYFFFDIKKKEFSSVACKFSTYSLNRIFFSEFLLVFKNADNVRDTMCFVYAINVASDTSSTLVLHDLECTSEMVKRRFNTKGTSFIQGIKVVEEKFVIVCTDYVHLVNARTLKTLYKFQYDLSFDFTHHMNVMGSVACVAHRKSFRVHFLDMTNHSVTEDFGINADHIVINNSCSKMVITSYMKIHVIHFW